MKKILFLTIFSLAFLGAVTVQAEDEIPVPTLYEEAPTPELIDTVVPVLVPTEVDGIIPNPELIVAPIISPIPDQESAEGVFGEPIPELIIEEIKKPTNLGLWWTSAKESFVMAFTFNPEKRVERALSFAEQRMEMAESFAQNAETEEDQAKATKMMEKAESFIQKAEEKKEDVEAKTQERLEEKKVQIEEHKNKVEEYNTKKTELIEKIKSGDEGAKLELQDLNEERKDSAELIRLENKLEFETRRLEQDEKLEAKKEELLEKVEEGDERASKALEALNQAENKLMEHRENVDAKRMEIEQNRIELSDKAQEQREEMDRQRLEAQAQREQKGMLVGGDKDEHGCIGSAGYLWCASKEKCLRPFEDEWTEECQLEQTNEKIRFNSPTEPLNNMIQKGVQNVKGMMNIEE